MHLTVGLSRRKPSGPRVRKAVISASRVVASVWFAVCAHSGESCSVSCCVVAKARSYARDSDGGRAPVTRQLLDPGDQVKEGT